MIFRLNLEKAVFKLTLNLTSKLQFNGFLFSWRVVSSCSRLRSNNCLCLVFWMFICFVYIFSLLISRASRTFLLNMFNITAIVLGWIQLNCPWHSLVWSVAQDDSQLPFMLSCWCSMQCINVFFLLIANIYIIHN